MAAFKVMGVLISRYTAGAINITWLQDGQVVDVNWTFAVPKLEGKLASRQSELILKLILSQTGWLSEHTYTCLVQYQGNAFEESAKKCADSNLRGPSPLDLFISSSPMITGLVVSMVPSKGTMNLTWSHASKKPVAQVISKQKKQCNGTVTIMSTLPVGTRDWIEGETYHCRVTHSHLPRA
ncbi:hypothetical protein P7K49_037637 [Saguinus oedipus]|uniref:Immunoglobulin C1-set domain-containing protein n=1 Tax=Saguinus oedipus TaxID=9490 RepID=A0ABQ9TIM8_SAGOE|nr:hypothetical protein P7K49_037637 [Saguinus oedipus]